MAGQKSTRKKKTKQEKTGRIFEIEITLAEIEPPIRRKVAVADDFTLAQLHDVIQTAMGWENAHLHSFQIGNTEYESHDWDDETMGLDESRYRLAAVLSRTGVKFLYVYDFGDNWIHLCRVARAGPPDAGQQYPVCLEGERNGPPEDCGGPWGYMDIVEVLAKGPQTEEQEDMLDWLGDEYDPEALDLPRINQELARMSKRKPAGKQRSRAT